MTKKTIEQLELMMRREVMRLEKSFTEDYLINSRTVNILSERVRAIEGKDIVLSISNILAKCEQREQRERAKAGPGGDCGSLLERRYGGMGRRTHGIPGGTGNH